MSTALSKAEKNALSVSYEVFGTTVELDLEFVKNYLVRGRADLVSNQEVVFFMNTCKGQNLNPLVNGEVYLIKFSKDEPAQMVVGKDAYLRRAFANPDYLFKTDGITVRRGNSIVQKEGTCKYPGEELLGGWCRITFLRGGKERTAFKEVDLNEYNKGMASWKTKPATMINKVAVSQCVRDAFPKDYEGVYSEEEMVASGAVPVEYTSSGNEQQINSNETVVYAEEDLEATTSQKQEMFRTAKKLFDKDGNNIVKEVIKELGFDSTNGMKVSDVNNALAKLNEIADNPQKPAEDTEETVPEAQENPEA